VTNVPDGLVLRRHRDLEGIGRSAIWFRRVALGVIAVVSLLALVNVFGQRPDTARADTQAATFSVYAPTAIRGGDFMEARFHVTAKRDLRRARLVLDPGWLEGMNVNTIEPSPVGQASADGRLSLTLGHVPAGQSFILFMEFQVNPTNVAWHRPQNVELLDGARPIARIHRSITIFP
jgi:hypothetical protein